jgi:hypothetical protein
MDGSELRDRIEDDLQTELSRLGSSKSLYADTEGEMDGEPVLAAAADAAHHAVETFAGWDHEVFADATERAREQYETITDELGDHEPGEAPAAVAALAEAEGIDERLGATVGWSMVTARKATQSSGFFTGQADPSTASIFRSFGDDYEAVREAALEALDDGDTDWDAALQAAEDVVEAAYDEYVETLESLGVNPKSVC